jgi:O-6-methylguanine DNA methyltransferase
MESGICLCEFADRGGRARIVARLEKRHARSVEILGFGKPSVGNAGAVENTHLDALETQLREYFAGHRRTFQLSLELGGTAWQRQVWAALREIPYGSTASYGDLATRLGKPGGSRAVGQANGDNYVAIVVPCHRVVQADGGLRGYGGGLHRKRWLLDLEAGVRQLAL